jgi:hypothetical protein
MKLVLHIGVHKTGSTAIQYFMAEKRALLANGGLLYPSAYVVNAGHHELAWALAHRRRKGSTTVTAEEIVRAILDEAEMTGAETIVLSSEAFERLKSPETETLKVLFGGMTAEIIVYLRRQDDALLSIYNQRVKSSANRYCGTLDQLAANSKVISRLDYRALIQRWAEVFGSDALRVKIYDQSRFPEGNVIPDFLASLGVAVEWTDQNKQINQSIDPLSTEIIRRLNRRDIPEKDRSILLERIVEASAARVSASTHVGWRGRESFMALFAQSNAEVARKWFGRQDGVLFENDPDPEMTRGPLNMSTEIEAVIDVLLEALVPTPALSGELRSPGANPSFPGPDSPRSEPPS